MKNAKALNDRVIVKVDSERKIGAQFLQKEEDKLEYKRTAKVLSVGPKNDSGVKVGDRVLLGINPSTLIKLGADVWLDEAKTTICLDSDAILVAFEE